MIYPRMLIKGAKSALLSHWAVFSRSEDGAVMVEWVALASGLVVGAIAISFIIMQGLAAPAGNIASQLTISSPSPAS